jgi:hypothetical protein
VSWPGPTGVAWALGLIAFAGAAGVLGEFVRAVVARWAGSWRSLEAVERAVLDFYLGGATMYLLAALPGGLFLPAVVVGAPIAAGALLLLWVAARRRRRPFEPEFSSRAGLGRPAALVALAIAGLLFAFELAIALPVPTGNTYDSSLLTLYVALLLQHHTIPLSFQPYAAVGLLYPQGTTVWLGWAQTVFALPAARTSLLVTPLFFGLVPLGGFVFGRRAFGTDRAAVATAVFLAAVGSWTRVLVAGSNDFVFAFPLVLLLAGQSFAWTRGTPPRVGDAAAFGLLVGYSAAMNPVGAEWLIPALVVGGALARPAFGGSAARWLARWATAVAAALLALVPTFYVLAQGLNSPGLTPGAGAAPTGSTVGLTAPQFVGSIDPYLFRPTDVWLSPIPFLRLEIAVLLTIGLGLLVVVPRTSALRGYLDPFRRFLASAALVQLALLGVLWAGSAGFGPGVRLAEVTSGAELSIWLFTLYTLIAGTVLVVLVEWAFARPGAPRPAGGGGENRARGGRAAWALPRGALPLLLVFVIVVPGVALTPTELPPVLSELYQDFGNVSAADFALLEYASAHLPSGARVLIAPGSAAGFLPGYARDLVLLYPLVPGWEWINASYRIVVSQLTNATLNATGLGAMAALDVGYVIVTGNNTVLWPAFSAAPLLANPAAFDLLWSSGDAYLFERTGA